MANAEARISALEHLEQKVNERELTRAAAEAAEEMTNGIESHENVRSAALQEIEDTQVFWTGQRLQLSKTRV